ncbi:DUF881 domain-containing protein [Luteococcus sp. Sow4_B9]|uniref:DUF881 domain-containing protein n=1 Tax=Luteococcus sp. Sow4_B9 TaxID=3438792 RepID=UPI003F988963
MSEPLRRPDASMDLLTNLQRTALDPEYLSVRRDGRTPAPRPGLRLVGLAMAACLLAIAALQTNRHAPEAQAERNDLVNRIQAAEREQDVLRHRVTQLDDEVGRLRTDALPVQDEQTRQLAAMAGMEPVVGPGIVVVVDDAPELVGSDAARVTDQDLRRLVNGLWTAGAEAVAVNGHRITVRTAIRSAGSAITVDYRSLNHPYRVEAVGDPRSLGSALAESDGGHWWTFLKDNYRLSYEVTVSDELRLKADPGLGTGVARAQR